MKSINGGRIMSDEQVTLEILEPRGELTTTERLGLCNARVSDLNGKTIAICSEKPDSMMFFDKIEELLKEKYPDIVILRFPSSTNPFVPDNTAQIAASCDTWLDGIKTSTSGKRAPDIELEKLGKPGVSLCVDNLMKQKRAHLETCGMPTARVVSIPGMDYFKAKSSRKLMDKVAAAAFEDVVDALTEPLTYQEREVKDFTYDYAPKTFIGKTYSEALENFLQYCADHFIGDGLPMVPPTSEAVEEMLKGTSYPRDKVIGLMEPKSGIATVEKIAVSAAMAGAKPEYLPIIIAMIETITDENFNQYHIVNEIMPVTFLSGPIVEELGINNNIGYFSPGFRQNSTIARSLAMCSINIGWRLMDTYASPGGMGSPESYTYFLVPENQKMSPWESYTESIGFKPDENTVTICETLFPMRGPSETLSIASFEEELARIADIFAIRPGIGGKNDADKARYMVVIHPTFASQLAEHGFTRRSFIQWLHDKNSFEWDKMSEEERNQFKKAATEGRAFGIRPEECKSGLLLEPFTKPEHVALMVSGGVTGGVIVFWTFGGSTALVDNVKVPRPFMHKVIKGATLTKSGK